MLQLKNIKKDYLSGEETVHALKGLDISFRENEFVSILGQSGCGKTTLLNIIGGLDRYTSGDLLINGKSTKEFKDRDWDTYRNHSIGFVFQSYNLIPHQNVLSNVELALTISGVSKAERRRRAKEALEKVGLGNQLKKRPNQMSGGQMQRVAIARALVNNPDILLADEPTGALDSETSVQVMEILKEVAKDKLVIMVTHNPDLAERYSTRIVRLLDGEVISDSMPYNPDEQEVQAVVAGKKDNKKKPSMSVFTGFGLSLNNLLTKKGRTLLTAFAGSIGIIGIALIMSLSNGMQNYIDDMEEETLTSYPITIEQASMDSTELMASMMSMRETEHEAGKLYSNTIMTTMMDSMLGEITTNDLAGFKEYLEEDNNEIAALASEIQYSYDTEINLYAHTDDFDQLVSSEGVFENMGMGAMMSGSSMSSSSSLMSGYEVCQELVDNQEMLENDYELLAGSWPSAYNEVVLMVTKNYEVTDFTLYALGLLDIEDLADALETAIADIAENGASTQDIVISHEAGEYSYEDILGLDLRLVLPTDYFAANEDGTWTDCSEDEAYLSELIADAQQVHIVGIIRATSDTSSVFGNIGYTSALTEYVINSVEGSEIVRAQKADPDTDVFTGLPFEGTEAADAIHEEEAAAAELAAAQQEEEAAAAEASATGLSEEQQAMLDAALSQVPEAYQSQMSEATTDEIVTALAGYGMLDADAFYAAGETDTQTDEPQETAAEAAPVQRISDSSYDENIALMHTTSLDEPVSISLYASSFDDKEALTDALDAYNDEKEAAGENDQVISYTDYVGLLMSSVTRIVNIVSYVLIAFVSISLIVSSIMIGVITLISVQERTKEIGVLRSIGASKKDVSRVFNAETIIIGFVAGLIGVGVTLLLDIPINLLISHLTGIATIAKLPASAGIGLVVISVLLTMIAGLIPSRAAAKKDPVEALRTE